jgi:hypothetical protein
MKYAWSKTQLKMLNKFMVQQRKSYTYCVQTNEWWDPSLVNKKTCTQR